MVVENELEGVVGVHRRLLVCVRWPSCRVVRCCVCLSVCLFFGRGSASVPTIEHTHGCGQFRSATQIVSATIDTPARLLRLLALMSSRSTWRGDELAERLEITERSVRRDITRLRDLGHPIESVTGPYGGDSPGAGGRLPPPLLGGDAAGAVAGAPRPKPP